MHPISIPSQWSKSNLVPTKHVWYSTSFQDHVWYLYPTHMLHTCYTHAHVQDWRVHYEQMHVHKEGIESTLSETQVYLDKLHQEISKTLEKITSREKYINTQVGAHTSPVGGPRTTCVRPC